MGMNHRELVRCCVEVLDTYDVDTQALEQHVNQYLKYQQNLDDSDQVFIVEVFSGCVRYANVLKVVVDGFFARDGKSVLRSEENLYRVLCYLGLFRLDELGMAHYRRFVRSQDVSKMYKFMKFFSEEKNLRTWMKDEWNKLYENSFVQTTLLSPILRWSPELQELVQQLKDKIDNRIQPKKQHIAATETKPFNLTQPRPRSVPVPSPIPKLHRHMPTPKTTYQEPREQDAMNFIREQNRRRAEERLIDACRDQFACANPEKSDKTKQRMHAIMQEEEGKLDFERHKAHVLPTAMLKDNIPIRLNAAAILREGRLYRQKEEEDLKKLELLEAGAKDASDFLSWQSKMRQQDLDKQLADIERRRLEGKLSHEDAILARGNLIQENKEKVQRMKEEAQQMMKDYLEEKFKEEEDMRNLVETVMQGHHNAKEAQKKLKEYKSKIVREVNEESRELMRQALEQAEAEMRQKVELIQQIRAMEAVPVNRHKFVDLAEAAGHGLLSEMSVAELKERVSLLKISQREAEDDKRDDILAGKQAKDQLLMDTIQAISRHRTEQTKAAALKLEEKKKTHNQKSDLKDDKLIELQRKLEERREQRKREQQQAKLRPDKKSAKRLQALSNAKKAGEEARWQELEQTRERTAKLASRGILSSQSASRVAAGNRMALAT